MDLVLGSAGGAGSHLAGEVVPCLAKPPELGRPREHRGVTLVCLSFPILTHRRSRVGTTKNQTVHLNYPNIS